MKFLILIFVFVTNLTCNAETNMSSNLDFGNFWATFYAAKLGKSGSLEALLKNLPLSAKNHDLVLEYEKQMKVEFVQPKIEVSDSVLQLKFSTKNLSVDFSELNSRKLKLNGNTVTLDGGKTFLNYKSEVFLVISRNQASNSILSYLIPSAYAQGSKRIDEERMAHYIATLFTGVSSAHLTDRRDPLNDSLENWIIAGYVNNVKARQSRNAREETSVNPDVYSFRCRNGVLESLTLRSESGNEAFRKIPTGWEYEAFGRKIQTDNATKITKLTNGPSLAWNSREREELAVGTNLLSKSNTTGYFLGYAPFHFAQCCQRPTCPEAVNAAMRATQQQFQSGATQQQFQSAPPRRQKSAR